MTKRRSLAARRFQWKLRKYFQGPSAMSQRELARVAGVTHSHIGYLLAGEREPTLTVAEKIAKAIGKNLAEMIS